MCRSIRKLRQPEPPTPQELEAAALQFVRKISGSRVPAKRHEQAFQHAVQVIAAASADLLDALGPPRRTVDMPTVAS